MYDRLKRLRIPDVRNALNVSLVSYSRREGTRNIEAFIYWLHAFVEMLQTESEAVKNTKYFLNWLDVASDLILEQSYS